MVVFSSAAARATNVSGIHGDTDSEEEPGEEIESAPPLKVGEEREINKLGLKKKLLKKGHGWETPDFGDEVTGAVHYVGTLLDGSKFISSKDTGEPFTFKLGHGEIVTGLDHGIITMRKGEIALFTLPPELGYEAAGGKGIPPNSRLQFEVELISWIIVMDVCKDGGIIKKVLLKGERNEQAGNLDEVTVKYEAKLVDGSVVAKTPDGGVEFYVKDGHFCPALTKVLKTMKRGEKVALTVQPQYAFGEHGNNSNKEFPAVPSNATLEIDLELVSFKPVIDVTGDSNVLKKILMEGEGIRSPNDGATVRVRYTGMLEDGTIFEKRGFDEAGPFEFVIDEEQVVIGLDRATATMKKGERSLVTVKPEYGFGNVEVKLDNAVVPASSTVIYEVELVDFPKEKESFEMTILEKIEAAESKKEEGNKLFKSGKYRQAAKRYAKASDYVSEEGNCDDGQKLAKSLRVSCWLNNAACSLKLNDFKEVIKFCSKVLDVEPHNIKALFRRAQAYKGTSDLELAELDIKKALEIDPLNREVKSMQKTLKQLQAESNKRDAKLYSNMFSLMRKDTKLEPKRLKLDKVDGEEKVESSQAMEVEKIEPNPASGNDEMVLDSH